MPASVTRLQPLRLRRASDAAHGDAASAANAPSLTRRFQYKLLLRAGGVLGRQSVTKGHEGRA